MIETLIAIIALAIIVATANYALDNKDIHRIVVIALLLVNLLMVAYGFLYIYIATLSEEQLADTGVQSIEMANAIGAFVVMLLTVGIATLLLLEPVRRAISGWFPRRTQPLAVPGQQSSQSQYAITSQPDLPRNPYTFPAAPSIMLSDDDVYVVNSAPSLNMNQLSPVSPGGLYAPNPYGTTSVVTTPQQNELQGFSPQSTMHMVALIYCVYLVGQTLASVILAGGVAGLDGSINAGLLLLNFLPQVLIPLLGVGFLMRRSWSATLKRLGLTNFSWESIIVGVVLAVGLFFFAAIAGGIWSQVVPRDVYEQQTEASEDLAESIDSIWLVLGIATAAAIGEEIAFRGALQPILGLWWTAIIFVVVHAQYTLTPAALIIFVVALALGWVRRRYNLYAAITLHFVYNFIIALLSWVANEMGSI